MITKEQWLENKKAIVKLSDQTAYYYDAMYGKNSLATSSYMRFESSFLQSCLLQLQRKEIAYDIGCGTGRLSFQLAPHFKKVVAWDISTASLLIAMRNARKCGLVNINFELADIETSPLPSTEAGIDLIVVGFGMGSLVGNVERLLEMTFQCLAVGGIAMISFYNSNSLARKLPSNWPRSLSARLLPNEDKLLIDFRAKKYLLRVFPYAVSSLTNSVGKTFKTFEIKTYPTVCSVLPEVLLQSNLTRKVFERLDYMFSQRMNVYSGSYILVKCCK